MSKKSIISVAYIDCNDQSLPALLTVENVKLLKYRIGHDHMRDIQVLLSEDGCDKDDNRFLVTIPNSILTRYFTSKQVRLINVALHILHFGIYVNKEAWDERKYNSEESIQSFNLIQYFTVPFSVLAECFVGIRLPLQKPDKNQEYFV